MQLNGVFDGIKTVLNQLIGVFHCKIDGHGDVELPDHLLELEFKVLAYGAARPAPSAPP